MNEIVSIINAKIGNEAGLDNVTLFGVAEPVVRREGDYMDVVIPVIIKPDGECMDVLHDDIRDITSYHRLKQKSYTTIMSKGFGNDPQRAVVYDMSLVVYGKRSAIDFMRLERICVRAIEGVAMRESVQTEVTTTNFNRIEVWQSEYAGLPFPIEPDIFLFKINYKLTRVQSPCH